MAVLPEMVYCYVIHALVDELCIPYVSNGIYTSLIQVLVLKSISDGPDHIGIILVRGVIGNLID